MTSVIIEAKNSVVWGLLPIPLWTSIAFRAAQATRSEAEAKDAGTHKSSESGSMVTVM